MSEKLPQPSIDPPASQIDLLYSLDEQRDDWVANRNSTSWDGQRVARIALANLNLLLDYYPDGQLRELAVLKYAA